MPTIFKVKIIRQKKQMETILVVNFALYRNEIIVFHIQMTTFCILSIDINLEGLFDFLELFFSLFSAKSFNQSYLL